MITFFSVIASLFILLFITFPSLFLSAELLLGLLNKRVANKVDFNKNELEGVYIVIPAHNEEMIIKDTLVKLKSEVNSLSKVLVVADNCTDATAPIAEALGATVVIRNNNELLGKGYAIQAGVDYLQALSPEVVIVFDADCEFTSGSFNKLAKRCIDENSVIQSAYIMKSPEHADIKIKVAEFAWFVKNVIRPKGLALFNINCQLQGSGMAFPASVLEQVSFSSGSIVEDLELGLKLNAMNEAVIFDNSSLVISYFPTSAAGTDSQRTRWEHGHLSSISMLPKKFLQALLTFKIKSCFTILDAMLPPTVLWLFIVFGSTFLCFVFMLFNVFMPFLLSVTSLITLLFSLSLVWFVAARHIIQTKDILLMYKYIFSKLTVYKTFITKRQKKWVKTDRSGGRNE
ncbi:glycosyltransferase family 2 protein [Pseudoalteromonas sp. AS71]|uniref:glycosyltransferase family 2 protein n=1 Tax=unclassified Pseudoalteromonas TaxID=194690 RepID=UPI0015FFB914|nr:glycosyltransferase family 2 protein [Pseudoalteromonas sp. SG45-2]MBB1344483.1 glycosyltransferase family 2 protein [Pseudoalteromonas sp. SG45-2]|tara:strand:- start:1668 stop:2870 length:1203 start_codon:yes stop_codon:yes gene_type:complete